MFDRASVDRVSDFLDQFLDSVNFQRPGVEASWGEDVAWAVIRGPHTGEFGGIMGRCADQVTPDGATWPENSDDPPGDGYRSRKARKYGWEDTNFRTGDMLSAQKLYGRTTIEPRKVTLIYGDQTAPTHSVSPTGYISEKDKKITDVEKAAYAHESGRAFYGIGPGDAENVSAVSQEALNMLIRDANGGP